MNEQSAILPHNIEAEQAYLGILINDIDVLNSLSYYPMPTDFFLERHKILSKTIYDLLDTGKQIDIITLAEVLRSNNALEKIGSEAYLSELTDRGFSSQSITFYIDIIIQKSQRRSLIQYSYAIQTQARDESVEVDAIVELAEKNILSITDRMQSEDYFTLHDLLSSFTQTIQYRLKNYKPGDFLGIKSGYDSLDAMLMGFHEGELIILAARPSRGKTAFALNLVHNIAIDNEVPVPTAFFSLEMSGYEITSRLVCMRTGIQANKIRQNMLTPKDVTHIVQRMGSKFNVPLFISDTSSMNLMDLRIQARRLVLKEQVKIIFIDYLGLIGYATSSASNKGSVMPRYEKFSEISGALKSLARELKIPIVVLSQLNRDSEEKEPTLANIRESGAIEQDADVVMMLHRQKEHKNNIQLIIAKQRNGPVGSLDFNFEPTTMTFKETQLSHEQKFVHQT